MDLRPNKDFVGSSALASYAVELCPIATTVLIAVRENASNIILDSIFVPLIEVIAGNKYGVELDLGSTDVVLCALDGQTFARGHLCITLVDNSCS